VLKCPPSSEPIAARADEVVVVDGDVLDAGLRERRNHRGFPDALGEPRTARALAERAFDLVGQRLDLADAIARGIAASTGSQSPEPNQFDLAARVIAASSAMSSG
jgi:hypothetical protein